MKECPVCGKWCLVQTKVCEWCGHLFGGFDLDEQEFGWEDIDERDET